MINLARILFGLMPNDVDSERNKTKNITRDELRAYDDKVQENPKVWIAKISQIDTDPPTIDNVFLNTFGETFTTQYDGSGEYSIISAEGLFDADRTQVYFGTSDQDIVAQPTLMNRGAIGKNSLKIYSFDSFLTLGNGLIQSLDIKIETYL